MHMNTIAFCIPSPLHLKAIVFMQRFESNYRKQFNLEGKIFSSQDLVICSFFPTSLKLSCLLSIAIIYNPQGSMIYYELS